MSRTASTQWRHYAGALGMAVWCSLALAAWAQSIKIPDFRQTASIATVKPEDPCNDCGRILSIREVHVQRSPGGTPAYPSGATGTSSGTGGPVLVGAVIYLPLGGGNKERPFIGGVGTPEMRERFGETTYEIAVRLGDGSLRIIQRSEGGSYQVGDRVRVAGAGQLELLAN